MRSFLNTGSEITLQPLDTGENKKFHIERALGSGASSLVYDAYVETSIGKKYYRLKECFPNATGIRQSDGTIEWNNFEESNTILANFIDTQKRIFDFQASENVGNNVVKVYDICRGNNTLYIVMETTYGTVYSADSVCDLQRIIDTMVVLSKIIKGYHNKGYLHLDIKPDNFMVCYDPNIWVWLFDFDTVTALEDIREGRVKSVPYSPGWEAPEQRLGSIKKVGECTDIYAIGAVLFYKLMGRKVEHDDLSIFSNWNLDLDIFKGINPKVVRLLRKVFDKTLSANVKRRYKKVDDLIDVLEEISNILHAGKPYLMSKEKESTSRFIGRTIELCAIREQFENGKRAVFLHGDGGIGKSSLAIKYGEQYRQEYDAVIFMRYRDSLESLVDMELCKCLQNFDSSNQDSRRNAVYDLMNEHTLLIVDNFDIEIDQDEYLDEFLEYKAHILFTSRTDFSQVYDGAIKQIEIKGMPHRDLMCLFETSSGIRIQEDEIETFNALTDLVLGNTYFIELFGRQIASTGWTMPFLAQKIKDGVYNLSKEAKVKYKKDGRIRKSTVPDALKVLFDISKLSEERRQALRNMYLLRFMYINRDRYLKYTGNISKELNAVNDLIELGWIKTNYNVELFLHPLVEELIVNELKPDDCNCVAVYDYIKEKIRSCTNYEWGAELGEYKLENDCKFLFNFFSYTEYSIPCNVRLVIEWLMGMAANEEAKGTHPDSYYHKELFKQLTLAIKNRKIVSIEECAIRYIAFNEQIEASTGFRIDMDGNIITEFYDERNENLKSSYAAFLEAVEGLDNDEKYIWYEKLYRSVELLLNNAFIKEFPKEFAFDLYERYEQHINLSVEAKIKHGFQLTDDERQALIEAERKRVEEEKEDWQIEQEINDKYISEFIQSEDKLAYIRTLATNESVSVFERTKRISAIVDHIFNPFHMWALNINYLYKYDWAVVEEILDIQEELMDSDECVCVTREDHYDWWNISRNYDINIIVTYALNGYIDLFADSIDAYMKEFWNGMMESIDSGRSKWFIYTNYRDLGSHYLNFLINSMRNMRKVTYIFPYILQHCEKLLEYAKAQEDYEEECVFPMYQFLVDLAMEAGMEDNVPERFKMDYDDIEYKYQDLMDQMADVDYHLKIKR